MYCHFTQRRFFILKIITSLVTNESLLMNQCSTSRNLELLACGINDLRNTLYTFRCIRDAGTCKNYMLQILVAGQGFHTINGKTQTLTAGHCILYNPGDAQHIIHYGSDNPIFIWMHFSGCGASKLVEDLHLGGIHSLSSTSGLRTLLLRLTREKRSLQLNNDYLCESYLLEYLVTLSRRFKENTASVNYTDKIAPAINHMIYEYASPELNNSDYAKMCYLSVSRFSHLFKELTGTTPKNYVEQRRMEAARELLSSTELSISEIALAVGYQDPFYFSRVFKKNVGIPPTAFRK